MHSSPAVRLRGLRAAVFGSATLLLAAAAHVIAGGPLPSLPLLLGAGIPLACASVVLARRSRGPATLLAALAVAQLLLHETFMTGAATNCGAMPSATHAAHAGHGANAVTCGDMPSMAATAMPSTWMVLLHVVATVATAALLAHGERIATRIWTWMLPRLTAPSALRVPVTSLRANAFRIAQLTAQVLGTSDLSRRGPPTARTTAVLIVTA